MSSIVYDIYTSSLYSVSRVLTEYTITQITPLTKACKWSYLDTLALIGKLV